MKLLDWWTDLCVQWNVLQLQHYQRSRNCFISGYVFCFTAIYICYIHPRLVFTSSWNIALFCPGIFQVLFPNLNYSRTLKEFYILTYTNTGLRRNCVLCSATEKFLQKLAEQLYAMCIYKTAECIRMYCGSDSRKGHNQ